MAEQIVIEFTADISKLQPAIDALEHIGQIDKKSADIFRATNAEYQNRAKEVNKLSQAYNHLSEEVASGGMKEHANDLKKTTDEIVKQKGETENLTKKLRAMIRELALMKQEGRDNTEQFRQMSREAGKLADDIGDAREQVKVLSSDTKRLDAVATAFRGLAAGMSVAAGAAGMLGKENEDLQKTILQVQSAMAVLTGVQELATIATGQNALKTYFLDAAQKAVAASAKVMQVSVTTATATMTVGLSLVAVAIGYIITDLIGANEEAEKLYEKMLEKEKEFLNVQQEISNRRVALIKDEKQRALKEQSLAEAREKESLLQRLKENKITGEQYEQLYTLTKLQGIQDREEIEERFQKKAEKNLDKQREKVVESKRKEIKQIEQLVREQVKVEADINRIGRELYGDEYSSFNAAQLKASQEFNMSQSDLMDEFYESGIEDFEEFLRKKRKKLEEDAQLQAAIMTATQQGINDIFEIQANKREAQFNASMSMLEKEMDAVLSNAALTAEQREAIEARYEARKRQLQISNWKAQQAAAVNQAIINTALAVTNALATVKPFVPAAIIAASLAGVSGGFQIAKIRSQPMPQFAEGTEFVEGAGTGTSDSITAKLSRGERVVPARTNAEYFDALSVIQNRLIAPELVNTLLTNIAENGGMLELPADKIKSLENNSEGIDYNKLSEAMQKGRSVVNIQMNEKGFVKHIQRGLNQSTYHNTKLRLRA